MGWPDRDVDEANPSGQRSFVHSFFYKNIVIVVPVQAPEYS